MTKGMISMFKKFILLFVIVVCMFSSAVFAQDDIKVFIYDEQIAFDVPPRIINSRTMVPMRKIFETLGATVDWYGDTQLIIATKNELVITMIIGESTFNVTNVISGEVKDFVLDSPPVIVNSRTLVPAKAISESLGYKVDWNGNTRSVYITKS